MAVRLTIPSPQNKAIRELAQLSAEAYDVLRRCVIETASTSEPSGFIERTSKVLRDHTALGGQILSALIGIRGIVDQATMTVSDAADGVAADARAKELVEDQVSMDRLSTRLAELLNAQSVAVSSKVFSLLVADSAPFNDARIVSDVRPVFLGREPDLEFSGSIIIHQLIIEVSGTPNEQHSSLTASDLHRLRRAVDRAIEKDRRLRETLRDSPMRPLEALTTDQES